MARPVPFSSPAFKASRTNRRRAFVIAAFAVLGGCSRGVTPPTGCKAVGIDVSRHQGVIDWEQVAGAGITFAWIKATEGGDYRDPAFAQNWASARDAGIKRGAYHFVYWCRPAKDQAAWFIANVPDDPDALPPVLDVEWNSASRSCPGNVDRRKARAEIDTMLGALRHAYARPPILYAPADIFADVFDTVPETTTLWARDLAGSPTYGGSPWRIWQYSETGRVPGIAGSVDLDCMKTLER